MAGNQSGLIIPAPWVTAIDAELVAVLPLAISCGQEPVTKL
jgi:hypothetical protein